ncbi:hypothetical protein PVAP13_8KG080784 [Panicum virgatum]|uniref:Uncharacterized protein n=1 Tax=Panicum virgatum TaxID=38727 RepID=A0A8T0PER8_PANVG|nr:hypothetical protein PVAP13_8KG080784 [Panicum virgatum]
MRRFCNPRRMRRFCNPSRLTAYLHRRRSSRKHHQGGHVGELLTCRSYGWAVCAGTHEAMAASKDAELGGNQVFRCWETDMQHRHVF